MIQSRPVTGRAPYSARRRALQRHGGLLLAAALAAFAGGSAVGALHRPPELRVAERYVGDWERGDWRAMYGALTEASRRRTTLAAFRRAHERAAATATLVGVAGGEAREPSGGAVRVPVRARTRVFGDVRGTVRLPFEDEEGEPRIAWDRHLTFPGVRRGEELTRTTRLPTRATLLAADGSALARGAERIPDDAELAASIRGELGPAPPERDLELRALGVPEGAAVGLTGLERALDDELRGRPGGELLAGRRRLALTAPRPAAPVRSTIDPEVQRAAITALAGRVGGAVALDPRTGAVRAAAGIGFSGLQPPGSTFKIVTLAGALQARLTDTARTFPVETFTTLEGVRLENANGEACGGTLVESFAESCNTVFAPLGARLGAERLVRVAEAFGFNAPPGIDGAATSAIPPADAIGDDLAVGSTAIGQGRSQATALQMAIVAATIARRGERPVPTLLESAASPSRRVRAIPARTARAVARAMRMVVEDGTGTAAAVPGLRIAGKTGTAELRSTVAPTGGDPAVTPRPLADPTDTTAWFAAYGPARRARIAVAVMLVEAGAGGETAAPAARIVLEAGLRRRG